MIIIRGYNSDGSVECNLYYILKVIPDMQNDKK